MSNEPKKPLIVISYAHADEPEHPAEGEVKWLSFVTGYLRPAIKHGAVDLWVDQLMPGGADWEREIEQKLSACDIFILLISRHSLSSDYVVDKEISIIRERQANGEAVHFYPLVLTPTPKIALDLVRDKNLRPSDGKPFSDYSINERYRLMNEAADEIAEISSNIPKRNNTAWSAGRSPLSRPMHRTTNEGLAPQSGQPPRSSSTMDITDLASLESWMTAGGNRVAAKLAARAVLRALPILLFDPPHQPSGLSKSDGELVVSAIFRAASLAQFSGFVPPNVDVLRAWPEAAEAADALAASIHSPVAAGVTRAAASAVRSASSNVAADAVAFAVQALSHAVEAMSNTAHPDRIDAVRAAAWESIRSDAVDATNMKATAFARLPLWKGRWPAWANDGWLRLQSYLARDHDWRVWIGWYDDRLEGRWRDDDYEHVFVNVPKEEWYKGPAAANAWIRARLPPSSPPSQVAGQQRPEAEIEDEASLKTWLEGQSREVAVTIATRAALRASPLALRAAPHRSDENPSERFLGLIAVLFRASALGRVAGKYASTHEFRAARDAAHDAAAAVADAFAAAPRIRAEMSLAAVARAAAYVAAAPDVAADAAAARAVATAAGAPAAHAYANGHLDADEYAHSLHPAWDEIRADVATLASLGSNGLADAPLWSLGPPNWADGASARLRGVLAKGEDWDVWIDWYEERLRGGSRGEAHELVFASVPLDVWDEGPAAANAWIRARLPPQQDEGRNEPETEITDRKALEDWLRGQSCEVVAAIAARAALRVSPLLALAARERGEPEASRQFVTSTSSICRALASAWVAAKYPVRADELHAAAAAAHDAAVDCPDFVDPAADHAGFSATCAARAVAADIIAARPVGGETAPLAAAVIAERTPAFAVADAGAAAFFASLAMGAAKVGDKEEAAWDEIRLDVASIRTMDASVLNGLPLWPRGAPGWANDGWASLQAVLPKGEDWEVWFDWFGQRLRGGSRGEAYELVFARVPEAVWKESSAVANAWIREHLPKGLETPGARNLPAPLPRLDAPFSYGWNASPRVAVVAGAQNLPFYPNFKSEEDHRHALEACRVGAERLLKSLRSGRYNARREYGEALEFYLDDLPKTAGAGNILLANDQMRILHAMFLADLDMLPAGFASPLKSVIANQFALNAFYDLVQRHNEAVAAGNWTQPFPMEAAKIFFSAVNANTPRFFEPEVGEGLRRIEQSGPPPSTPPEPQPAALSAIQPPPLPPGTPDAERSHERQMATAANALWEAFLKGQNLPVAKDEWREIVERLGTHVRPLLDFLRALEAPK